MTPQRFDRVAAAQGFAVGLLYAAATLFTHWSQVGFSFSDPDDAMRLVQIRDLLAGQAWGDWIQHRMQQPEGVHMHWSRIDDLPVASMLWALKGWLGQQAAERVAMLVWPVVLMPVMFAVASGAAPCPSGASRSWRVAATAVACTSFVLLARFSPGRIDHHAIMTTLAAAACATLLVTKSRAAGIAAGACSAVCLGVGLEDVGVLATLGACAAGLWLSGEREYPMGYADGLFLGTLATAAVFVPSDMWNGTVCDALSMGWIAPVLVGSGGMAASIRLADKRARTAACAIVGVASVFAFVHFAPQCLQGPFAGMSDVVKVMWLDHVGEMQSVFYYSRGRFDNLLIFEAVPFVAFLLLAADAMSGKCRARSVAYLAVHSAAMFFGLCFVRNGGLPVATAAPVIAAALSTMAWVATPAERIRKAFLATSVTMPLVLGYSQAMPQDKGDFATAADALACSRPANWIGFAMLPRGKVLTPIDVGAYALANTPHAPVTGGYHRADRGMVEVIATLVNNPPDAAKAVAISGADYVAWCRNSVELDNYAILQSDSFGAGLRDVKLPEWLEPISVDGAVRYARVKKALLLRR